MEKHPKAGIPLKIERGPFKGQYFKVIDYLKNQFQGKRMEKLAVSQAQLVSPVVMRGYPLDDYIVYGELYPTRQKICVHDQELLLEKFVTVPLALVEDEKEIQDDTGKSDQGNNQPTSTGESEPSGRSVPSAKADGEVKPKPKRKGKTDSEA